MIVKQYIKDFEKMGLGMFVHFGIYAVWARGEWLRYSIGMPKDEYDKAIAEFKVDEDWAYELVKTAKDAGCKYITLTTRHHDGFSLYDTCGMNTYDAPHSPTGRDLVREFVDECNKQGIVPFFYHTLIDWSYENFDSDFPGYLKYLRDSIEILCTRYGKIGGLWFDGMWGGWDRDWEEDALYGLIRKHQPDAMIINNTGTSKLGEQGHIELDSVTFERGETVAIDLNDRPKYLASEMCQILGSDYWGYARDDMDFKPMSEIIGNLINCRRHKANLLLNVGPMANGKLCLMDRAYFEKMGVWMKYNEPSIRDIDYVECNVNIPDDFVTYDNVNGCYYLYVNRADRNEEIVFDFDKEIASMEYMDGNKAVNFEQKDGKVKLVTERSAFGVNVIVRVIKITTK